MTKMDALIYSIVQEIHRKTKVSLSPLPTPINPQISMLPDVKAVIFDIYGTLLVSGSGDVGTALKTSRREVFRKAIIASGITEVTEDTAKSAESRFFSEIEARHAASRSLGIEHPEVDIIDVWKSIFSSLSLFPAESELIRTAVTYEVLSNPVSQMPGASELLKHLKSSCIHLGIVSNAQFFTRPLLEYELCASLEENGFDMSLCSFSYIAGEAKPSIAIFSPVLRHLSDVYGIVPSQALYVGNDMLNDIYTASRTGMRTCLFAGDKRSLRMRSDNVLCAKLQPDIVIAELSQILQVVSP